MVHLQRGKADVDAIEEVRAKHGDHEWDQMSADFLHGPLAQSFLIAERQRKGCFQTDGEVRLTQIRGSFRGALEVEAIAADEPRDLCGC